LKHCASNNVRYRQFIELAAGIFGVESRYKVLKRWQRGLAGRVNKQAREVAELLPRDAADNIFVSDKFKRRFPDFRVTTFFRVTMFREGLTSIRDECTDTKN